MPWSGDDAIQRALIEHKRQILREEFGVKAWDSFAPLPPEVENEYLDQVIEFERQYKTGGVTTVRHFIGNPPIRRIDQIRPGELRNELRWLTEMLNSNNIEVHFSRPVPDLELYRFVTEELLDYPIDNVRITGMTHAFVFEEFHPETGSDAGL
jgi:hypothetical protein